MKTIRILTIVLTAASLMGVAQAQSKPGDIVAVVSDTADLKTLLTAVEAAGLEKTLQGTGPFTVFAPTNEAFAKLPKETLDNLLKPENKEKLAAILTFHVVPGKLSAASLKSSQVKTVNGEKLDIQVTGGVVTVDGAKVLKTDIPASNGTIHLIDTVVMP